MQTDNLTALELQRLEQKIDQMASVQTDLRDAVIILTENQKRIEKLHEIQIEQGRMLQEHNVRLSIVEVATNSHGVKLEGIAETKLVNRAIVFLSGLIATGVIGLGFKMVSVWI